MKCQEVMELMQRHLDQDLNHMENKWLTDHLHQCPACAAIFERLKQFSCELEQLPKIVPPFSIVDSILPRLEQIELMHGESKQNLGADSAVQAAVPAAARDSNKVSAWFRRFKGQISLKAAAGIVAAGIVIGLMLVTHKPFSSFDSADADNRLLHKEKGVSPMRESAVKEQENTDKQSSSSMAADQAPDRASDQAQSNTFDDNSAKAKGLDDDNHRVMESEKDSTGESAEKLMPKQDQDREQQSADQVAAPGTNGNNGADFSNQSFGVVEKTQEEPNQVTSKQGAYTAFVDKIDTHLRVVIVNKDQETLYISSEKAAEQIVNLHWSDDSRYVDYDTRNGDELHHYTIDMVQGVETGDVK